MIDRQTSNVTYSSAIAHQHTALLTLPDHNMPPMEVDTTYQGCPTSCKLHSRSLTVRCTGACDLEIAHTCYTVSRLHTRVTQSPDCTHMLHNLQIAHTCYTISRLCTRVMQSRDSENAQRNLENSQIAMQFNHRLTGKDDQVSRKGCPRSVVTGRV